VSIPHDRDPVGTAQNLTQALTKMSERLDAAVARERRTRRIAWGLAVSVLVDVVFTVVVTLIAIQAHHASTAASNASMRAQHASASNLALCRASNVARHQQIELWDFLLQLAHGPETPQQKRNINAFRMHLDAIFAPRDCTALGKKRP